MSHFSTALREILENEPKTTQSEWADRFGVHRPYLTMLLAGSGSLGHKTIGRMISQLSRADREKLIGAYFLDEAISINEAAAGIARTAQELTLPKAKEIKAAVEMVTKAKTENHDDALASLPLAFRTKLLRFLKHAETEPRHLKKLEAMMELVDG